MNVKTSILTALLTLTMSACSHIDESDRLIYVKPADVKRRVLLEDFTGQRCVNCPKASDEIKALQEQYGEDHVIAVGIHSGPLGFYTKGDYLGLSTEVGDEYYDHWALEYQPVGLIDRGAPLEYIGGLEIPLYICDGLMCLANACITHTAVLVAPVGIVHIVVHEVIHFLGGSHLGAALSRRAEDGKMQGVDIVEHLVGRQIVGKRTVVHTVYPVVAAKAGTHVGGKSPAVVHGAGCIRCHKAQTVQRAVGQHAAPEALAHLPGSSEYVGHTVVAAQGHVGDLGSVHGLLGAHGLIQAAPKGEGAVSCNGVIHLDAGKIDLLALGIVSTGAETHGREIVSGNIVEHVIAAEQDGRVVVNPESSISKAAKESSSTSVTLWIPVSEILNMFFT